MHAEITVFFCVLISQVIEVLLRNGADTSLTDRVGVYVSFFLLSKDNATWSKAMLQGQKERVREKFKEAGFTELIKMVI